MLIARRLKSSVRELAELRRPVFQDEQGERPRQEHQAANHQQSGSERVRFSNRLDQPWSGSSNQAHTDIHDAHGRSAISLIPMRNDDLMRNRYGEDVSHRVHEPEQVIEPDISVHAAEAEERKESQKG